MTHPRSPSPEDLRKARLRTGLTKEDAAFLVYRPKSYWVACEIPVGQKGHKTMHPSTAELFAYKTGLKELKVLELEIKDE